MSRWIEPLTLKSSGPIADTGERVATRLERGYCEVGRAVGGVGQDRIVERQRDVPASEARAAVGIGVSARFSRVSGVEQAAKP